MAYRILVADDELGLCHVLSQELKLAGFEPVIAHDGLEAIHLCLNQPVHAVILDLQMPNCDGLQCLKAIHQSYPNLPAIIITAYANLESAIEAMRFGADDYLVKPFDRVDLIEKINRLIKLREVLPIPKVTQNQNSGLLGDSPEMIKINKIINKMKDSATTVLITGESGTGKGVTAKEIHRRGARAGLPFIYIDCSALPGSLIESELFGYEKGSFTGANASKKGKFECAENGTVFLDEITSLPIELQAKLLNVLQERVIYRLGSTEPIKVQARFLAATNDDFKTAISEGRFREDLYYRLNVVNISLPPLRQRKSDIHLLAVQFFRACAAENRRGHLDVEKEVYEAFEAYDWPGNVRELANTIESIVVLSDSSTITCRDLPAKFRDYDFPVTSSYSLNDDTALTLKEREMRAIISALVRNGGHRERTAFELGITRRTLQNKIRQLNLNL